MIKIEEKIAKKVPGITSLFLEFKYHPTIIEVIKSCDGAQWDNKAKIWEVPILSLPILIDHLSIIDEIDLHLLKDKAIKTSIYNQDPNDQYKLFQYQKEGVEFGLSHDRWLLLDVPGLGKAVTLDTPVLTPDGFIAMRDVHVGTKVYDRFGKECCVIAEYNHDDLEMYDVEFTTGERVTACKDHLWQVIYNKAVWNKSTKAYELKRFEDVLSTEELLKGDRYKKNCLRIPFCDPIDFPKRTLPIDPYALGCLLGDGSFRHGLNLTSQDPYIVDYCINEFRKIDGDLLKVTHSEPFEYKFCSADPFKHKLKLKEYIRDLGLDNHSSLNKFIPDIYKYSSIEDRIAIIQGLMDTDGTASSQKTYKGKKSNNIQFGTSSEKLKDDFIFLIQSIGGYCTVRAFTSAYKDQNGSKKFCSKHYTIGIHLPDPSIVFRLDRKKNLVCNRVNKPRRKIKSITYVGNMPGKCITVNSPTSCYIIKDCIVTHNTLQIIKLAEELKKRDNIEHCLIICGINTLKYNWKKEINKFSSLTARVLGEHITKSGKITSKSIPDCVKELNQKIDEFFIIINIEKLRDENLLKALTKNKANKFDMIAYDEVHKSKDPGSQQGSNLLKVKAKYQVGATGTMILNSPEDCYLPLRWIGFEHSTFSKFKYYYLEYGGPFGNMLVGFKNTELLKRQIEQVSLRRTKDLLDLPPKNIIDEYVQMDLPQQLFYDNIKDGIVDQVDKVKMHTANLLAMVTRLRQATEFPQLLTSDKNIKSAKIERCLDLVDQILSDPNEKVVIFSCYKEPCKYVFDQLKKYNPLLCTGDVPDTTISQSIDIFQNDAEHRVMVCTGQKMGTGITLNRAHYAIFLSTPWTAGVNIQWQDRIHRIGTKEPVFIYNLWTLGTIDERVKELIDTKGALSDYVIDDQLTENNMDILRKYIEELRN